MGNLIWLLAFGALFFFMMRWGCGGGHNHESHNKGGHEQNEDKSGGCH